MGPESCRASARDSDDPGLRRLATSDPETRGGDERQRVGGLPLALVAPGAALGPAGLPPRAGGVPLGGLPLGPAGRRAADQLVGVGAGVGDPGHALAHLVLPSFFELEAR